MQALFGGSVSSEFVPAAAPARNYHITGSATRQACLSSMSVTWRLIHRLKLREATQHMLSQKRPVQIWDETSMCDALCMSGRYECTRRRANTASHMDAQSVVVASHLNSPMRQLTDSKPSSSICKRATRLHNCWTGRVPFSRLLFKCSCVLSDSKCMRKAPV